MRLDLVADQDTDASLPIIVLDVNGTVVDLSTYDNLEFCVTTEFDLPGDPLYTLEAETIILISEGTTGRLTVQTSATNNATPQIAWYHLDGIDGDLRTRLVSGALVILRS